MSEMGQGKLMGFIHCTWIPFILVAISQSHLSPLSRPYSANPPIDLKTHISTGTIGLRAAKGGVRSRPRQHRSRGVLLVVGVLESVINSQTDSRQ